MAPLLCYFKRCASFRNHRWIQTEVKVWKRPIWVKIGNFLSRKTLKFDGWPWKTIGHLLYATSSLHHFVAIGKIELELQSENAEFGSKLAIVLSRLTLKFDRWPWKTIEHRFLLYYFKLCASFRSHRWIEIGVTVRKRLLRVKIGDLLPVGPWNLTDNLEKQHNRLVHHFIANAEFKLELQPPPTQQRY